MSDKIKWAILLQVNILHSYALIKMERKSKFTPVFTLCETLKAEILFFKTTETGGLTEIIDACGYTPYNF